MVEAYYSEGSNSGNQVSQPSTLLLFALHSVGIKADSIISDWYLHDRLHLRAPQDYTYKQRTLPILVQLDVNNGLREVEIR